MAGEEGAGAAVDQTVDGVAERPAKDGVDGDVVVDERVREDIGDDCAEETSEVLWCEGGWVFDCSGESDGFERLVGVIEVDKGVHAGR